MKSLYQATRFLKQGADAVSDVFHILAFVKFSPYRIEEIDVKHERVAIRCRGNRMVMKLTFAGVLRDEKLIAGLPALQACILGGYIGRALRASRSGRDALRRAKQMTFLLKNKCGRYKMVYQNRTGEVGYIDKKTKREFLEQPLVIVNHDYIMKEFDPSQACYVGILAGISMEKALDLEQKTGQKALDELVSTPPKLRVVD
jgi:hypothetical protein